MMADNLYVETQKVRQELAALFQRHINRHMAAVHIEMDSEIRQEIRERIAVMMFDEMVNDMPVVPYLAVWEDGGGDIIHAYMSPNIEALCDYTPQELRQFGFNAVVKGDIVSFYREGSRVEKDINPIHEARKKRVAGFLENTNWEACYRIEKKDGRMVWVVDRSTITRYRNTVKKNVICIAGGILLESTGLMEKKSAE